MNLAEVLDNLPIKQLDVAQVVQLNGTSPVVAQRPTSETARLEALLKDTEDLSTMSPELLERGIDENFWYHVTPFRSALIRSVCKTKVLGTNSLLDITLTRLISGPLVGCNGK